MANAMSSPSYKRTIIALAMVVLCSVSGAFSVIKIMPLGDSVTDGSHRGRYPGAYRIKLYELCKEAGIDIDFVGSKRNGPESLPDKEHEGYIGMWSDCITKNTNEKEDINLKEKLDTFKPDILLVLFGYNDVGHGGSDNATRVPSNLGAIIDLAHAKLPATHVIIGTLTSTKESDWQSEFVAINKELPGMVNRKKAEGKKAYLADHFAATTLDDLADNVHPNAEGYAKIAKVWFDVIAEIADHPVEAQRYDFSVRKHAGQPAKEGGAKVFYLNGRAAINSSTLLLRLSRTCKKIALK